MLASDSPEVRDAVGELVARNEQGDPDWIRASAFRLASVRASDRGARNPTLEQEATRLRAFANSRGDYLATEPAALPSRGQRRHPSRPGEPPSVAVLQATGAAPAVRPRRR